MGESLKHMCARFGYHGSYALPLASGLLWGGSLINTGLVASFPSLSLQLGVAVQSFMFLFFVIFFALFAIAFRKNWKIFDNGIVFAGFAAAGVVGTFLVMGSADSSPTSVAQNLIGSAAKSCSTSFFLFLSIRGFLVIQPRPRLAGIAVSAIVACVAFSIASFLPAHMLKTFCLFLAIVCAVLFALYLKTPPSSKKQTCLTSTMPLALYALYGVCMGAIPGLDALSENEVAFNAPVATILAVIVLGGIQLLSPKQGTALRFILTALITLGAISLFPLGVSVVSAVHAVFIFSWLFFWAFLALGIPFVRRDSALDPLLVIIAGFAFGWFCFRLLNIQILADFAGANAALSLIASGIAIAIPIYSISQCIGAFHEKPADTPPSSGDSVRAACCVIAGSHNLTKRETEVLFLLAAGYGRQYVSEKLVISEGTARTHIKHIYSKLEVHCKEELLDLVHEQMATG